MKKLLLLGIACALSASAMAQTEKGAKYLGANIGNITYQDINDVTNIGATLTPSVGIFVADNLLIGSSLPLIYGRSHEKRGSGETVNRNISYGLVPYVRYYFVGSNAHRFFGQLGGGVSRVNYYYKSENSVMSPTIERDNGHYFTYGGALGYNYFLTPGAALEVIAGYNRYDSNRQQSNGSLDISAGFSVFLPSKLSTTSTGQ
ncbi:outer membrane beta-barrel protein [Hymenobacter sp. YC55]|uniref:outer membrane beta-barrel protein n=1 Tax=Hymenobacter sp. YC55 TaxID=3034019 RepID=UPI0023F8982A|nr:outer membrane beta-barrel protein [Hymenobacter sp. YC55]MDF7814436.1 outer membrane beta-barrel protein [Hymenobacter sp. YC55]